MSIFGVRVEDQTDRWIAIIQTPDIGSYAGQFMKTEWDRNDIPVVMVEFSRQHRLIAEEQRRARHLAEVMSRPKGLRGRAKRVVL